LGLAAVCGAVGLLLLVSLARNWADYPRPSFVAWILLGLACVWSIFVRPAVLLDVEGVTIRNVLRDVHIPWPRVTDVEARWNLKVFAGERGYTAWAISSQVERPKATSSGMFGGLTSGRLGRQSRADGHQSMAVPQVTASTVARSVEQAKEEYDEAVATGVLSAAPDGLVRVTWVPLVFAVLLLPAIAVAVLSLS
jgi:hypothetical protein